MKPLIDQIKDLIQHRTLLRYLVASELRVRYKSKSLGFLWAVLDPFFMMLVYMVLISVIFDRGGPRYPVELFAALLSWRWFSYSIGNSVRTLTSNAKLIQTVQFPLSVFPLSRVLFGFVNYLMGVVVLIPLLYFYDATWSVYMLWLPVLWVLQFVFTVGASFIVSVVGVYFRDLQNILDFSLRIFFYLSPGLYSIDLIPEKYLPLYLSANPFASLFNSYKNILVRGEAPTIYLWCFVGFTVVLLLLGLYLFSRKKNDITKAL